MQSFLEQHCPPEWLDFIKHHKSTFSFGANETIFSEGDPTKGLYIVNVGKVKVVTSDSNGRHRLIRLAGDGTILGHRGFGGDWTYPITAITLEESEVVFIPLRIFEVLAKTNPDFTYNLMMFFAEELRESEEKIMQAPVKNRVAKAIYLNYEAFGFEEGSNLLSFTLSRKDYASKAGTSYETVIRVLSELNKRELIKSDGKAIRILNLEGLKRLSTPPYEE